MVSPTDDDVAWIAYINSTFQRKSEMTLDYSPARSVLRCTIPRCHRSARTFLYFDLKLRTLHRFYFTHRGLTATSFNYSTNGFSAATSIYTTNTSFSASILCPYQSYPFSSPTNNLIFCACAILTLPFRPCCDRRRRSPLPWRRAIPDIYVGPPSFGVPRTYPLTIC